MPALPAPLFQLFNGVFGIGLYSIFSLDIETRDTAGNLTGSQDYIGSAGYLSYAWDYGVTSIGITLKCLYERIGNVQYMGGGADIGMQIYPLPFLKLGFVVQDLGTGACIQ